MDSWSRQPGRLGRWAAGPGTERGMRLRECRLHPWPCPRPTPDPVAVPAGRARPPVSIDQIEG
jgi:hypothetical protein